uniref:hypothetical protein n=1 Tax=Staphylococcus pettenkoferi TaxID=170573 RepID=UPI001C930994
LGLFKVWNVKCLRNVNSGCVRCIFRRKDVEQCGVGWGIGRENRDLLGIVDDLCKMGKEGVMID